jgi:hypothetical protein
LYKRTNYKINEACLGDDMVDSTHNLVVQYQEGTFDLADDWAEVSSLSLYFTKYCEYDEILYDLSVWCTTYDCTFQYMGQNLLKKVFQVTTVANHMAEVLMGDYPESTDFDAVEEYWANIGEDVGKLLRYATDFDYTLIAKNFNL